MRNYTLIQLALGTRNLFDLRRADLLLSKAGKYYEPALAERRAELDALPAALTGGLVAADKLRAEDALYDGHGGALFYITEVVLRLPTASDDLKAAALRVREAFVPELAELRATYVIEAHRAHERRPLLITMKGDLESLVVPGGGTALDLATNQLDAGERLNELLNERGSATEADRTAAVALRPKTVKLLNRLRDDLVEELAEDLSLPRDLEHRVFGYFDTVAAMGRSSTKAEEPVPAEPVVP